MLYLLSFNTLKPHELHTKPLLNSASSLIISRPKQNSSPGRAANGNIVCYVGVGDGCGDPVQNDIDGTTYNPKPL